MHLITTSLALLLLATAVDLGYSFKCNNAEVTCLPGTRCPRPPAAGECCSKKLMLCGSCMVCLKYLEINQPCERLASSNAICRPPLTCGSKLRCVRT